MATLSYHEQKDIENIKKLRELQKELPSFCSDFFRGIETSTSTRTRIAYAYDLKIFFQFLKTANPGTFDNPSHTLTPSDLEKLTVTDLEEYIDYLKCLSGCADDGQQIDGFFAKRGILTQDHFGAVFYDYRKLLSRFLAEINEHVSLHIGLAEMYQVDKRDSPQVEA